MDRSPVAKRRLGSHARNGTKPAALMMPRATSASFMHTSMSSARRALRTSSSYSPMGFISRLERIRAVTWLNGELTNEHILES